ncbi:uncharacterized protein ARB_01133 [Trichophyton benhamiae CBS 112371]|uniref:Protein ARV n=2 Tax=Trichophyton TaxID=5550 RepID=D4AY64_ARTBC|nr:uncharacterized protein ARB_01133 [Trichophyton benhamiae CBS 112371]XP_003023621.1 uncharacterized protein TRV_02253 [Trichophyton verrucosum HKI 0517]EFE31880.1 hypothetical protein ARB_01133 [Trichophyton benhamiae CBS 112371]EFE43003.1 hypothetical protein TRV_02253 [Trichophyton verrucosum HKI 0517]
MPICIECCYPVSHLYTSYSKADDRALGKGVRLTQCARCQRFADKYVEHDFVVLFIDLVLIKPQRSIIRLGILILLFDVYLSWARIEKSSAIASSRLGNTPIIVQYVFFLTLNALATLAHHVTVRFLATILVLKPATQSQKAHEAPQRANTLPSSPSDAYATGSAIPAQFSANPNSTGGSSTADLARSSSGSDTVGDGAQSATPLPTLSVETDFPPLLRRSSTAPPQIRPIPPPALASRNAISTALLVSSCTKLFPILLVIWGTDASGEASGALETSFPPTGSGEGEAALNSSIWSSQSLQSVVQTVVITSFVRDKYPPGAIK